MDPFSGPSLTLQVCGKELSSNMCTELGNTFIRKGTEWSGFLPIWAEIYVEEIVRFLLSSNQKCSLA